MRKKLVRNPISKFIAKIIAYLYINLIYYFSKWTFINKKEIANPAIFAFWHGRLLMMPYLAPKSARVSVISSAHSDGAFMADITKLFGINTVFFQRSGSNKKALREIINIAKNGGSIATTPDGSRGPCYLINNNIIDIARLTGLPIIPISYSTTNAKLLNSWDKFMLPYPFGKGVLIYGNSIAVPRYLNSEELEAKEEELKTELDRITKIADQQTGITQNASF